MSRHTIQTILSQLDSGVSLFCSQSYKQSKPGELHGRHLNLLLIPGMPMGGCSDTNQSLDVQEDVMTPARCCIMSVYDRSGVGGNVEELRASICVNIKGDML